MHLQPTQDRLLLDPDQLETKTESGLEIVRIEDGEQPGTATVLAIGPKVLDDGWYPVGSRVVYSRFAGSAVTIDDVEYRLVREQDIIAVEIPE